MSKQQVNPEKFNQSMARQKQAVDQRIAAAKQDKGLLLLLTGDGKGKSTSGFGMVMRALGHGQKVGVVQFIKGTQASGEEILLRQRFPEVSFHQMGTGFTWETQDHEADRAAAQRTWAHAEAMLEDPSYGLVLLDELTYMLAYRFLDESLVLDRLRRRPPAQSVVITGRGGGTALRDLADTVAEVKSVKHAFDAGIKARAGVDY